MSGSAPSLPPPPSAGGNILRYVGEIWRHLRRTRVKAGNGMRLTQTEDGAILSLKHVEDEPAQHPFKINAEFDSPTPTGVLCTVTLGRVNNTVPRYPGTTGDPLNDTPEPVHTIALTADIYYFSLVVEVTKDGVFDDVYIEVDSVIPADVVPVPDDMPNEGDPGTAGQYVFNIGELEIYDDAGVYSFVVRQSLSLSQTFHFCDGEGYIVGV